MTGQPFPSAQPTSGASERDGAPGASRDSDRPGHPTVRRILIAVLALAVAAAVGWWLWVAAVLSNPPVRWQVLGFETHTEGSVDIRWSVDRDAGLVVECVVRARNAAGEEVGRDRVPVPASSDESVEVRHTLTTSDQAVTGEVLACLPVTG